MPLILKDQDGPVVTLTFNDPNLLNAMTGEMGKEFSAHLKILKKDKNTRVVILTGAGRAFSSGGNLDMLAAKIGKTKAINGKSLKNFYQSFLEIRNLSQPFMAVLNGPAVGAGFGVALACDLRYAATEAKMGANFARIGLAPGMGCTYLLTRLVGPTHAADLLMTGRLVTATEAKTLGLINAIFPEENLLDNVKAIAQNIATNASLPVHQIKKGIQHALHKSLDAMMDYDAKCQSECFLTEDIREGVNAVREKRVPKFF
jgi:enoyl-CoA hydratase